MFETNERRIDQFMRALLHVHGLGTSPRLSRSKTRPPVEEDDEQPVGSLVEQLASFTIDGLHALERVMLEGIDMAGRVPPSSGWDANWAKSVYNLGRTVIEGERSARAAVHAS